MGIKVGCDEDLSGKVAIVTGSNTGIGLQTAKMLCDAGAHVVMACRSEGAPSLPSPRSPPAAVPPR